ncbi:cupin domain-containing protein [Paraburkholderia mimosarum]|uniref:cupin domain-containing protein n=1 Tax=Paraburkholderia mimosarum TaxID=312026 RepID=UPI0039C0E44C
MNIRRVVTGHDQDGNSVFLEDGPAPRAVTFDSIPGHAFVQPWTTVADPTLEPRFDDPTLRRASLIPVQGATSLLFVTFPPDNVMASPDFDPVAAGAECASNLPGLAETFEVNEPGMHRTDTIDYAVVLSGEIWLELDGKQEKVLRPNDVVIQNGTRHAWRNKSSSPATVIFFMVGAQR